MNRSWNYPWGVHRISDIYTIHLKTSIPNGWTVLAVCEPHTGNRIQAAWWVLTGRAHALRWPKPGDLEFAIGQAIRAE